MKRVIWAVLATIAVCAWALLHSSQSTKTDIPVTSTWSKVWSGELYPDSKLTPGAILPVTKDDVCVPLYTAKVRNVPESEKKAVFKEYWVTYPTTKPYEVDHFISLELGGSNDITNLWPEPADPTPGFHQKDLYENTAHRQVCKWEITLWEAQRRITEDWYKYYLEDTLKNKK